MPQPVRSIMSIWFPRLSSERMLRVRPVPGAFVVTYHAQNSERLYCLNAIAEAQGLYHDMPLADARAFCPDLHSTASSPQADEAFLTALSRWAGKYCPWVGFEGRDGLVLDVTGAAHLWGGETALLQRLRQVLTRAGLTARLGVAHTRGAAWALAHYGEGRMEEAPATALAPLPIAALRLDHKTQLGLTRLGLRSIADLLQAPRAPLARRFGPQLLLRLDQALGTQPEAISPTAPQPHYGVRMSLPEPIGLIDDVMGVTGRLLERVCVKLRETHAGTRRLRLWLRRVDQESQEVELCLARALRDAERILPLFRRGIADIDAGYGIDQIRLEACDILPLPPEQIAPAHMPKAQERLDDLITLLGSRIGLENIRRVLPAQSHIPERSFVVAPAAYSAPETGWSTARPRPLRLFRPEAIGYRGARPPIRFRWRRMQLRTGHALGPERIAPEWWLSDPAWHSGVRDYWVIQTCEGRRLWLFYTPQSPDWYVHGEFA